LAETDLLPLIVAPPHEAYPRGTSPTSHMYPHALAWPG